MHQSLLTTVCLCAALTLLNCADPTLKEQEKWVEAMKKNGYPSKLKHAFTIQALVDETSTPANEFRIYLSGQKGNINVHWGDGAKSQYSLGDDYYIEVTHTYNSSGIFPISISGDIKYIESFHSYYGLGMFTDIDLSGLSGLKEFVVGLTFSPSVIDLSANGMLVRVEVSGLRQLADLRLPEKNTISRMDISGPNAVTPQVLDLIIENLHQSAIKHKITQGHFVLTTNWIVDEEETPEMLGPPSATALDQLRELQNVYQWTIIPAI